jgi:hypothetical protein
LLLLHILRWPAGILPCCQQLSLCTMQVLVGGHAIAAAGGARCSLQQQQEEQEQEMRAAAGSVDVVAEHVFLYKLVPGVVASSYGVSPQAEQTGSCYHLCDVWHMRICWGCVAI